MGIHDRYVKGLFGNILGASFVDTGPEVVVHYPAITGRIDGVVRGCCAIEIESRTDKQVRGALLDLTFHPYDKKLLILVPAHMHDPRRTVDHCKGILKEILEQGAQFGVVLLEGTGNMPMEEKDTAILTRALKTLGCRV